MNYKSLLSKYINYVRDAEGADFILSPDRRYMSGVNFSEQEWQELSALAATDAEATMDATVLPNIQSIRDLIDSDPSLVLREFTRSKDGEKIEITHHNQTADCENNIYEIYEQSENGQLGRLVAIYSPQRSGNNP